MKPLARVLPATVLAAALLYPASASASQILSVGLAGTSTGGVISSPGGIDCGVTCSAPFADGANVILIGESGPNTQAVKWSGCDSVSEGHCKVAMSGPRSVTATFDLTQHQLAVTKAGTGQGTVTSSPGGIACGASCSASYAHGTQVTLTGSPAAGTETVKWAGCEEVKEGKCKVTMSQARSVTATFSLPPQTLSVERTGPGTGTVTSSPAGISCGSTCSAPFEGKTLVTLSAAPAAGSSLSGWSGCDSVVEGKCKVSVNTAKTVTASFGLVPHQLTVTRAGEGAPFSSLSSSPGGIACGSSCSASYLHGTEVTLTPAPGAHVQAPVWLGCDSVSEGKCKLAMTTARSVTAIFDLQSGFSLLSLSVVKTGTGQGTVTGSPGGIDCGPVCSAQLISSTQVTLSASPAPGSVFVRWGGACKGSGPCTVNLNKAKTVKASFKAVGTRTLSVIKAGTGKGTVKGSKAGRIDCGQSCSVQVAVGKTVSLTAKPAEGSSFAGWSGACSGAKRCKVKLSEAKSAIATFNSTKAPASPTRCVVPKLKGKTVRKAKAALRRAHCALGKLRKPKRHRKAKGLRVRASKPPAATVLAAGAKVSLKLGVPRQKTKRR